MPSLSNWSHQVLEALCAATFYIWAASLGSRTVIALWMQRHLRSGITPAPGAQAPQLICLLPAYREQSLVPGTMAAFVREVSHEPSAKVVVITSLREERERDANAHPSPTTTEVMRTILPQLPPGRFLHFVYTGEGGGKAVHLNFALRELQATGHPLSFATYIGVYDFDSRPEAGSLSAVAAAATTGPDAIVQPVLPVLKADASTAGAVADASIHVLRSLGAETFVWWLWYRVYPLRVLWRGLFDPYFVGAGLFVRADHLLASDGFPVPVDDVPLGFEAAASGWRVVPIGHVCLTQSYPDIGAAVRSRTLVFHAYCRFIASIPRRPGLLLTGTFREAVLWAVSPLVVGAAATTLGVLGHWRTAAVALVVSGTTAGVAAAVGYHIGRTFNPEFPRLRARCLMMAAFYPLWRALSAWRCAAALARARRGVVDFSRNKTPRITSGERP